MNKITLFLLCGSVFLSACDSSNDVSKESLSDMMEAVQDAATDAVDDAKELKEATIKNAGEAVNAAKESVSDTVDAAKELSEEVITKTEEVIAVVTADPVKRGESIYKSKCIACHGTGVTGAPKLGDKADWAPRIAQGNEVLSQHAIAGFKGKVGFMPPKGGFAGLSDEEISFAVQYMVSQSE